MADFYKFEIANWNEGTANLTLEQEAAYLRVVNAIRLAEQPITFNTFVLCGLWRCNDRKAKRILQELIDAGKVRVEDGKIVNRKAVEDASTLRGLRAERASAGRRGGIESGNSRRKPLENNDPPQASASTREEKRREENIEEESNRRPTNAARESSDPPNDDDDDRKSELEAGPPEPELRPLLAAGGIADPTRADLAEARRWLGLGLTAERIRPVLDAVRRRAPEPPRIAAYFGPEVERLASQPPPAAELSAEEAERKRLEIVQRHLRGTGRALPGFGTHETAEALIARGVLTGWDDAVARGFDVDRTRIPRVPRPAAE